MALIKCPECGNEISDLAPYCIHCGFVFNDNPEEERRPKNKVGMLIGIVSGSLAIVSLIILMLIFLITFLSKDENYKEAGELYTNGQYIEAAEIYSSLGGFKNSLELENDSYYKAGKNYISKEQYAEAIECFEKTRDYLDSLEQIRLAESKKELKEAEEAKEAIHEEAVDKMKEAYDACKYGKARLSYDGESITVDSDDEYDGEALLDIITITAYLDLPDSIIDDFSYTNALMGRQTKKYGNYEVSWSFHPKNGLDVTFVVDTE